MKFLSLRWKISGILVISNLVLGVLLVWIVNRTVSESIQKELIDRGKTIAVNLAQYSAERLIEEDKIGLKQLVTGALNFESVEYILILNSEGTILADTYNEQVPAALTDTKTPEQNRIDQPQRIQLDEAGTVCYDIWMPVEDGYLGYIRVGMKEDYITESVKKTNFIVVITIAGLTLVGIIVVLVLANRIISPILYLTRRADEISTGKLEEKVEVHTKDEIELLGKALERLRESVKIALDRLKKHQTLRM